jgi:hypothetical protein
MPLPNEGPLHLTGFPHTDLTPRFVAHVRSPGQEWPRRVAQKNRSGGNR